MLVLTRRLDEGMTFFNPDGTVLMQIGVVRLERGQVRLGIDAPAEIKVVRDELLPQGRGGTNGQG